MIRSTTTTWAATHGTANRGMIMPVGVFGMYCTTDAQPVDVRTDMHNDTVSKRGLAINCGVGWP